MNSKDRVLTVCNLQIPDRIPSVDFYWEYPGQWQVKTGHVEQVNDVLILVPNEATFTCDFAPAKKTKMVDLVISSTSSMDFDFSMLTKVSPLLNQPLGKWEKLFLFQVANQQQICPVRHTPGRLSVHVTGSEGKRCLSNSITKKGKNYVINYSRRSAF